MVKGNLGFSEEFQGNKEFHYLLPAVFTPSPHFVFFHKTKHCAFTEAPSDLRVVYFLPGCIKPLSCAAGFLKDTSLKPANLSI